jgi:hypothetical protein
MFYRGVRGPSRGRGGQFPASSADAIAAFGSLLQPPGSSAHGISGGRLILQNRKDGYEDVFHAEMKTFEVYMYMQAGALENISISLYVYVSMYVSMYVNIQYIILIYVYNILYIRIYM